MANEPTRTMQKLADEIGDEVAAIMSALEAGEISAAAWETEMQNILARGHLAGYMLGAGTPNLEVGDFEQIANILNYQFGFLDNFGMVIDASDEFSAYWLVRAGMYVNALNSTYWEGRMRGWALPAMPGQGTICLSNCRCAWREEIINRENGDADFYWELDPFVADGEHCPTCLGRAEDWYPIQIRNGELLI